VSSSSHISLFSRSSESKGLGAGNPGWPVAYSLCGDFYGALSKNHHYTCLTPNIRMSFMQRIHAPFHNMAE